MITPAQKKELLNKTDIVQVVREFLPLYPNGKNLKGLCPFHQEITPSFIVSHQKQIFKCFGCGQGGDAIGFLMKIERKTFPEAISSLRLRLQKQESGTVYVLELEDGHYYIGYTNNLEKRISSHFNHDGAAWTMLHKPIRVIEIFPNVPIAMENETTRRYMRLYGWRKVRGGEFVRKNMAYREVPANIARQKKDGIYLLHLEHGKYYIGFAQDIQADIQKQFNGKGCEWTRLHKPVKVLKHTKTLNIEHQKELTLETMRKYGWQNVRGYLWNTIQIKKPPGVINRYSFKNVSKRLSFVFFLLPAQLCLTGINRPLH